MRSVFVLLALAGLARAQSEPLSDQSIGLMHYQAGQKFYQSHHYQEAIAEFSLGYHLTRRAAFLLNIAQAHRQLGQLVEARDLYRQFLGLEPKSPLAPEARRVLGEIEQQLGPTPASASSSVEPRVWPDVRPPPADARTPPADARPPADAQTPRAEPRTSLVLAPAPPVATARPRSRHIVGWTGVGVTAAALLSATIVEALAASSFSSLQGSCAPPHGAGCSSSAIDGLSIKIDAANGLFITSGILAAGTIVAFIVEHRLARPR
jgi:tetratricopeptide (TPR) repeat protein